MQHSLQALSRSWGGRNWRKFQLQPLPKPTNPCHNEIVERQPVETLGFRDIGVVSEEYAVSADSGRNPR